MRKLLMITSAIFGLGCLYPTTISAQTCTAAPSCADMGYTKTVSDCSGKNTLKCPFDLTKVSCEETGNPFSQSIIVKIKVTEAGASFRILIPKLGDTIKSYVLNSYTSDLVYLDCGNGTKRLYSGAIPSCTYDEVGEYIYSISGKFKAIELSSTSTALLTRIIKWDMDSLVSIFRNTTTSNWDKSGLTGNLPDFPPNLEYMASYLFQGVNGLSGTIPSKPSKITTSSSNKGFFSSTNLINDGSWPSNAW